MSNISKYKNGWFLLLFIMIGIVLGGLIAESTAGIESLSCCHMAIPLGWTAL